MSDFYDGEFKFWRYQVPADKGNGGYWGTFYIDSNGLIMAHTDCGTFSYSWGKYYHEPDFRLFLLRLHTERIDSYLEEKFGRYHEPQYDEIKTLNHIKVLIFTALKRKKITKEEMREELRSIRQYYCNLATKGDFDMWWYESGQRFLQPDEGLIKTRTNSRLQAFVERVLHRLKPLLRRDLEAEGLLRPTVLKGVPSEA